MSLETLLAAIKAPRLPNAACLGRHELFDSRPADPGRTCGICRNYCPALPACTQWLASLAPSRRPSGVVAGQTVSVRARKPPAQINAGAQTPDPDIEGRRTNDNVPRTGL